MNPQGTGNLKGRPLVFGEVLYDKFEKKVNVLGGASFNVAWHLQGFGLNPLFISCVGHDELGRAVREKMENWGMDICGLQQNSSYPTGVAEVRLQEGEPSFELLPQQAYDHIDATEAWSAVKDQAVSFFYHGTLAARHPVSCSALEFLTRQIGAPVFADVNLRAPWWTQDLVTSLLKGACWVKMNEKEVAILSEAKSPEGENMEEELAEVIYRRFGFEMLIVTLGSRGAFLLTENERFRGKCVPVKEVVDTVGAGDAFSAVSILGLTLGWLPSLILERSLEFANRIVSRRGATSHDSDLYSFFVKKWNLCKR